MNLICFFASNGNLEKTRAPEGIQTHNPLWSSQILQPLSYWRLYSKQGWNAGSWLELHHEVTKSNQDSPPHTHHALTIKIAKHMDNNSNVSYQDSIVLCQSMNDTDVLLMILLLRHLMPYNDRCLVVAPVIGKTCTMFFCTAVITSQTNYNVAKCHYLD